MAWDTGSTVNDRLVYSETVTLATTDSAYTSTMDFIGKDESFVTYMNTGATNTVGAVEANLLASFDGTTWTEIDASFAAALDTATVSKAYVATTSGDYPYYRVEFVCAGADAASTIVVKVII